ncbi:MAG: PorT family protein, partial [Bacteroidota bacterium]|nr:PorT family protein [Bacteroidota bacterium]
FAQSVSFGVKAGANFSKLTTSSSGISVTSSSLTGFHVGAVADIGLGDWSLQPGLLYSTKGGTYGTASDGTVKLALNYLEVPVNLLYNIHVGVGKVFIGAGPYLGWGVSGKGTATGAATSTGSGTETNNITFGSGANDTKNPDFGINILGGFRFTSGLSLSAGYGIGLANLSNDNSGTIKNNVVSLSVGYFF